MIKVIHIVGARPQFMKLSPLFSYMKKNNFSQKIIHTGQHFDSSMSEIFFDQLSIPKPDYNLNINNLPHGAMTGRMIEEIEKILSKVSFDFVIVYGDTNSTIAGALAAKKIGIKVIHIESGCRNDDIKMPEEINRIITDRISDILFCNTEFSMNNLYKENFQSFDCIIQNSGDLMLDCLNIYKNQIKPKKNEHILVTIHRAENTELDKLKNIISALNEINKKHEIIFPLHPRTRKKIIEYNLKLNFSTIPPVDYFKFLDLLSSSRYLITDSGGAVREAYWLNIPSLLVLENPLWPELISAKVCIKTKAEVTEINTNFNKLNLIDLEFPKSIFGNGNASEIITNTIQEYYDR